MTQPTTYPLHFICENCTHAWDEDIPLRWRVSYSNLEHAMVAQDQAQSSNAQIIMCPNCNCLEDVRKAEPGEVYGDIEDQE